MQTSKEVNSAHDIRLTPQAFSAARRGLPFGAYRRDKNELHWDVVSGLVAVSRGKTHRVLPDMLYGVVPDNNGFSIATYWVADSKEPWDRKTYSVRTLRQFRSEGLLRETSRGLTYKDMVNRIRERYPEMPMPTAQAFYAQFGLNADQVENKKIEK